MRESVDSAGSQRAVLAASGERVDEQRLGEAPVPLVLAYGEPADVGLHRRVAVT